jgi:hypothetical protein
MEPNICLCGTQAGYPHPFDCPHPYYGDTEINVQDWNIGRALIKAGFQKIGRNMYRPPIGTAVYTHQEAVDYLIDNGLLPQE